MLNVGDQAPNFTLPDQDERPVSLKDFAGQWVVLCFYPKDNTSGCTKEAIDFTDRVEDSRALHAVVVGVSRDNAASHRRFRDRHHLRLMLLSDADAGVHKAYGAWGVKKNYGREYEGVIRSTFLISPEGRIAALWRNVRVRVKTRNGETRHADKVYEKLFELQRRVPFWGSKG